MSDIFEILINWFLIINRTLINRNEVIKMTFYVNISQFQMFVIHTEALKNEYSTLMYDREGMLAPV